MIKTGEKWDILPLLAAEFDSFEECDDAVINWQKAYRAKFPLHDRLILALKLRVQGENGKFRILIGKNNECF